jgi:hypothetical protein
MTHPKREDWIPYLCGEAAPQVRQQLEMHLQICPVCDAQLDSWKRSFARLDAWKIPPARARAARGPGFSLSWIATAAAMLAVGFLLGCLAVGWQASSRLTVLEARLQRNLQDQLQEQVRALVAARVATEMDEAMPALSDTSRREVDRAFAAFVQDFQQTREEDRQELSLLFQEARQQTVSEVAALRKDLETVATSADDEIRRDRSRISTLLAFTSMLTPSNSNP